MNAQEMIDRRHQVGARAIGLLAGLLRHNRIPEAHRDHAQEIVDAWPNIDQLDKPEEIELHDVAAETALRG